ncbi:MAG: cupredoxin domain-containing protein [Methanoregula sp.]
MSSQFRMISGTACILLIIFACMAAGCTSSPAAPVPAPTTATGGENSIAIKNFAFNPSPLTVKVGTVVTWTNQDSTPHTIVSDTGSPVQFSSDTLPDGASYSFTFNQAGTYPYHCSIHPSMKGTIVVQ